MQPLDPSSTLFMRLARIPSPPRQERAIADAVLAELAASGVEADEDGAAAIVGGTAGNLYGRLPATAPGKPLFLCAHLDTIPPSTPIDPVVRDGFLVNRHPGIVGADNKAALAVMLSAVREVAAAGLPHAGIELVLTVAEEVGLQGVKAFDADRIDADVGFVFDQPGAIGAIVTSAPSRTTLDVAARGRAAHAGLAPEAGVNAIVAIALGIAEFEHGRRADGVSVNVGRIAGGTALNVVPEHCIVEIEVRSLDHDRHRVAVDEITGALRRAGATVGADVVVEATEQYRAYDLPIDGAAVALARQALGRCGHEPRLERSGGGADSHVLCAAGKECVTLSHGVHDFHAPTERVALADLVAMRDVTLALVRAACTDDHHPARR